MNNNRIFLVSFRNAEGKIKSVPCTYLSFDECANKWISYCGQCGFELVGIIELNIMKIAIEITIVLLPIRFTNLSLSIISWCSNLGLL